VLRQKRLDRQYVVRRRVVMVKNPWAVVSHFRSLSSHPFTKGCQNLLIVDLVNGLTSRHPINVKNPSDIERNIKLDLLFCAFFFLGNLGLFQCMDWRVVSGSYWKNHDSSQVITFPEKFGSFSVFWRTSAQMFIRVPFCSGVRILIAILEHNFLC
jgi:hypothetical protein